MNCRMRGERGRIDRAQITVVGSNSPNMRSRVAGCRRAQRRSRTQGSHLSDRARRHRIGDTGESADIRTTNKWNSAMSDEAGQSERGAPYLAAEVLQVAPYASRGAESAGYESALPLELLKLASLKASSSEAARELRDLQEIYADLWSLGAAPWKEPELFLALYALVESFDAPDSFILKAIRFHLVRDLEPPREWRGQYLRSPVLRGKLYRFVDNSSTPMDLPKLRRGGPVLVPVVPGLYFDALNIELYPESKITLSSALCTKIESSLDMIGRFSPALLDDILGTVNVVALVGDIGRPGFQLSYQVLWRHIRESAIRTGRFTGRNHHA